MTSPSLFRVTSRKFFLRPKGRLPFGAGLDFFAISWYPSDAGVFFGEQMPLLFFSCWQWTVFSFHPDRRVPFGWPRTPLAPDRDKSLPTKPPFFQAGRTLSLYRAFRHVSPTTGLPLPPALRVAAYLFSSVSFFFFFLVARWSNGRPLQGRCFFSPPVYSKTEAPGFSGRSVLSPAISSGLPS